jgi:2-octaprenylphenol hydroxylase
MKQVYDVIIVGGGIIGLTAALAMSGKGYCVLVIEANTLSTDDSKKTSRAYAINAASQKLLTDVGVWRDINQSQIAPYQKMHVWDAQTGAFIDFDSRLIAKPALGTIIEEDVLKRALLAKVTNTDTVTLLENARIAEIKEHAQSIEIICLSQSIHADLLMVADGAHSPTRDMLNVKLTSWPYHHHALVTTVQTEHPHQQTAYQVFTKEGALAFLPLQNPNHCSIVWSAPEQTTNKLIALNEAEFNQALMQAFAHKLGNTHLLSNRNQFPLYMRHVTKYSSGRWMILGDAAHTIHPLAGLGLNVGLADITTFQQLMQQTPGKLYSKKMLGAYQRARKASVWQTIMMMQAFKEFFSLTTTPAPFIRSLGLRLCNEVSVLKRMFIEHAQG